MVISFQSAPRSKQFGVKMESGIMLQLRNILQMDISFAMMNGVTRKRLIRIMLDQSKKALPKAEKIAMATKEALKHKIAQAASTEFQSRTLPEKLKIDPNDPDMKWYAYFTPSPT